MKLLNLVFTYNRPHAQYLFWDSLFNCTNVRADHTVVIDDGSDYTVKNYLYNLASDHGFDLMLNGTNKGYCYNWLTAYKLLQKLNPEYVFFLESDYVFRKNFLEECFAVFESLPNLWAVNGFSHPDFKDKDRIKEWFGRVTTEQFGSDIKSRDSIYTPFELETSVRKMLVQYSSHSCGTFLLNWKRVQEHVDIASELTPIINRACEFGERGKVINDGMISGGLSWLWDNKVNKDGDKNHASAFIDICDYSIGYHMSGDGVNAKGVPEGQSNVHCDTFPQNYKEFEVKNHE
jgi:hypothetical protein